MQHNFIKSRRGQVSEKSFEASVLLSFFIALIATNNHQNSKKLFFLKNVHVKRDGINVLVFPASSLQDKNYRANVAKVNEISMLIMR
ncbi:hypothetical protein [Glaciimonas immobilis]|uniref:Uncharacterized protein n=1 Tax=Glaciimonas immobilis TaxID=728004 RepID=A0A840RVE2_9BURK|nr:hypothetical protein [Glaciimonas immobilis]KAF3999921.1 hypothetical protein HAV38_01720 [Glaciimonas immobilis]MBB5200419.1 hypothetical protein [Glaciimonas immobilis]